MGRSGQLAGVASLLPKDNGYLLQSSWQCLNHMHITRPRASSILVKGHADLLSFQTTHIFSPPETSILTSIMVTQIYITISCVILHNLFSVSELLFLHLYIGVPNL